MNNIKRKDMMDHIQFDFDVECLFDWINDNLDPEEVFSIDTLNEWAENRGFTKQEK